jgi:uncharacterized protein
MKVNGSAVLHADRERVYAALNDPAVLAAAIPGCRSLDPAGDDCYRMSVTAGVASIKGTYDGEVRLAEQQPPASFTLRAKGSGAPGTVDATCRVSLSEAGDGTTRLEYDADAAVGGVVGGVGQRMLVGVAKKLAGQFFGNVDDLLTGKAVAAPPSAGAPLGSSAAGSSAAGSAAAGSSAAGSSGVAPQAVLASGGVASDGPIPAAVVGAVIALAGVLVGWIVGRRR